MNDSLEDKRIKFKKIFANLPERIRKEDIILVLDQKTYTWNAVFLEVNNYTDLGKEMLKKLKEMEIL